ncbi:hypothetical protein [Mycobacterium riyadhense]|nr:hypothetical protein [Mycobacterium riyadhense]
MPLTSAHQFAIRPYGAPWLRPEFGSDLSTNDLDHGVVTAG